MKENKIVSYLLYAIGEIALVVIGILIAVQIDDWNKSNERALREIQILKGIKEDLKRDSIDLEEMKGDFEMKAKGLRMLTRQLSADSVPNDFASRILYKAVYTPGTLTLHHAYFDEAKAAGLSIIRNTTLKDSIGRLYEFHYPNSLYVVSVGEQRLKQRLYEACDPFFSGPISEFSIVTKKIDFQKLRIDQPAIKAINNYRLELEYTANRLRDARNKGIQISKMIDREISERTN